MEEALNRTESWVYQIVSGPDMAHWWPRIEPWVEQALRRSPATDRTPAAVREGLSERSMVALLVACETAEGRDLRGVVVLTSDTAGDGERYLGVVACGGTRAEDWLPGAVRIAGEIGRLRGIKRLCMIGRPGWEKWLAKLGAKRAGVLMTIEVQ